MNIDDGKKRCTRCKRRRMLKMFYPSGDGFGSWCKDCFRKHRARRGGAEGFTPRLRRYVGRARITGDRERDLRVRLAAYFAQTPMADHEGSLAAALLDALDDLRDARSVCHRLRGTIRGIHHRIAS